MTLTHARLPLRLLARVQHVPPSNRSLLHLVVHTVQLAQADNLVRRLDQATSVKLNRLGRVLAVAHVAALDGHHLDDALEHGSLEIRAGRETDADDGTAGTNVLGGLLERLLADSDEEDGVRAQTIRGSGLHVLDDV